MTQTGVRVRKWTFFVGPPNHDLQGVCNTSCAFTQKRCLQYGTLYQYITKDNAGMPPFDRDLQYAVPREGRKRLLCSAARHLTTQPHDDGSKKKKTAVLSPRRSV